MSRFYGSHTNDCQQSPVTRSSLIRSFLNCLTEPPNLWVSQLLALDLCNIRCPRRLCQMLRSFPNMNRMNTLRLVDARAAHSERGSLFRVSDGLPREPPPVLPEPQRPDVNIDMDCADDDAITVAANGPLPNPPARMSPAPQASPVPNGKPTSPYNERPQGSMPPNAQIAAQTVSSKDPKQAAQQASDMRNVVRRKLTGYVGFANLPNQWHRKSVRKGFNFNVMVVGKNLSLLIS